MQMNMKNIDYSLPASAVQRLEAMVARIEAAPGEFIDPVLAETAGDEISPRQVIETLPDGLSETDFVNVLRLGMLTECATESYANEISQRARLFNAEWMAAFTERVWTPDELTHHTPYKAILLKLGFAEEELDRQILETQEKHYEHVGGFTPVHISTFGMVQEYLTDNWHGLVARLLRPASPLAAQLTNLIKKRETLHTIWYRDMTAIQIEANPSLAPLVGFEMSRFRMPGNSLAPELQSQATRWLPIMGADINQVVKDLVRLAHSTLNNTQLTGRMAIDLAAERNFSLGPLRPAHLIAGLDRLGGRGYGLVGEAILERVGLSYLFETSPETSQANKVRALFRSWLASKIPLQIAVG